MVKGHALIAAERHGFLRVRSGHDHHQTAVWWRSCEERNRPYLILTVGVRSASLTVDLASRREEVAFTDGAIRRILTIARDLCPWSPLSELEWTPRSLVFTRLEPDEAALLAIELVQLLRNPQLYEPYRAVAFTAADRRIG
jgi:hypothetical protein